MIISHTCSATCYVTLHLPLQVIKYNVSLYSHVLSGGFDCLPLLVVSGMSLVTSAISLSSSGKPLVGSGVFRGLDIFCFVCIFPHGLNLIGSVGHFTHDHSTFFSIRHPYISPVLRGVKTFDSMTLIKVLLVALL